MKTRHPRVKTGLRAEVDRKQSSALVLYRGEWFIVVCGLDLPREATRLERDAFSKARREGALFSYSAGKWPFIELRYRMLPIVLKGLAEKSVEACLNTQLSENDRRRAADAANEALLEWDVFDSVLERLVKNLAPEHVNDEALSCIPVRGPLRDMVNELRARIQ